MLIGELATVSGLSREALRFYEQQGLIRARRLGNGYRDYPAEAVRADGYGFQVEMAYSVARNGGHITEVPITFGERARGTSKMSFVIVVEALVLVTWWGLRDRVLRRTPRTGSTRTAA